MLIDAISVAKGEAQHGFARALPAIVDVQGIVRRLRAQQAVCPTAAIPPGRRAVARRVVCRSLHDPSLAGLGLISPGRIAVASMWVAGRVSVGKEASVRQSH
jgi:hypothetical protein